MDVDISTTQNDCMTTTFPWKISHCFTPGEDEAKITADHFPEQTVCLSEENNSFYICSGAEWLESEFVQEGAPGRHKRGFFKKLFRKVKKVARFPHDQIRRRLPFFRRRRPPPRISKICFDFTCTCAGILICKGILISQMPNLIIPYTLL